MALILLNHIIYNTQSMKVSVYDILNKSQNAVFHEDGLKVYEAIQSALRDGKKVEVSFENIKVCTTQFLNASFGKLLLTFGEDVIKANVYADSYNEIHAFNEKFTLVWENFQEKNKAFIAEAYA